MNKPTGPDTYRSGVPGTGDHVMPDWYWDFWCDDKLRAYDPEGCGIGLALGAVTIPGMVLGLLAVVIWLIGKRS